MFNPCLKHLTFMCCKYSRRSTIRTTANTNFGYIELKSVPLGLINPDWSVWIPYPRENHIISCISKLFLVLSRILNDVFSIWIWYPGNFVINPESRRQKRPYPVSCETPSGVLTRTLDITNFLPFPQKVCVVGRLPYLWMSFFHTSKSFIPKMKTKGNLATSILSYQSYPICLFYNACSSAS